MTNCNLSELAKCQLEAIDFKEATVSVFDDLLESLTEDLTSALRPLTATEQLLVKTSHLDSRSAFFSSISADLASHINNQINQ